MQKKKEKIDERNNLLKKIKAAISLLGITGEISIEEFDSFTVKVFVNGKEFGIWDTAKETFVE